MIREYIAGFVGDKRQFKWTGGVKVPWPGSFQFVLCVVVAIVAIFGFSLLWQLDRTVDILSRHSPGVSVTWCMVSLVQKQNG
jgi:hypothetical protein